jgi:DNA primase
MQLANLFWQVNRGSTRKVRETGTRLNPKLRFEGEGQRSGLQKAVLGMLVEYPDLLEDKRDTVLRLQFAEDLDRFLTQLLQLLLTEAKLSVSVIWDKLDGEFYETLQAVHGEAGDGKPRGHRLFERFPILSRDPPSDFVSECMDHFIKILHVHEIEDDIQRATLDAGQGDESAVARLLNLVRERHAEQESISAEGVALAERAEDIIRIWAPQGGTMHLAA